MRRSITSATLVVLTIVVPLHSAVQTFAGELPTGAAFRVTVLGIGPATESSNIDNRLKKVPHQIELVDPVSPAAPPRTYEVVQSLDENGFPAGFRLSFVTEVCNDKQCLPVEVTITWDALGYYERLTYPPGKPLMKKEHVPFTAEDYAKLDRILKDRNSILAGWTLIFLENPLEPLEAGPGLNGVDAVTTPTPMIVKDSVVEDAAYTSWALWHWANGKIVPKLRRVTEQQCTPAYLKHLLASEERRHADYALEHVIERYPSDTRFVEDVVRILKNGEREQIARALVFLDKVIPDRQELHDRLIESCAQMRAAGCPLVLEKLAAEPGLAPATLEALTGQVSELPYFPIHLILRILEQRKFASEKTISDVAALLRGDDFFVARRAYEHLAQQKLDADMQGRIDAFREENRDRL